MYRVTGFELIEYERDGKKYFIETAHRERKFLTAAELTEYSKTHSRFIVETEKWDSK